MTKEDKKYEVGYGKPPKSGQFKKGKSGNPKGRTKGRKNMRTIVEGVMNRKVQIKENGRTRTVGYMEAYINGLALKGLTGTTRERIDLLKAIHTYAPELLRELEEPRGIKVQYVLPDGKTMEDYDNQPGPTPSLSEMKAEKEKDDEDDDSWLD